MANLARPSYPDYETRPVASSASVRESLQRILLSAPFLNANRPSQFLQFVVERTLAGGGDRIKEYLIGVEVFGRPSDYDPKSDPVVRIEAGRLRKKLAEYYDGPGAQDPLVIELPKGGYVPVFQPRVNLAPAPAKDAPPGQFRPRAAVLLPSIVFLAATVLAFSYYVHRHRKASASPASIAVLPFLDLSDSHTRQYLSDGIAEELTTSLAQLKSLHVVASTSAFQFRGKSEDVRRIGQALNAEALLEGSISQSGPSLRVDAQLIDARNGYHLWSKAYDVPSDGMFAAEHDIVQQTARALHVPADGLPLIQRDTRNEEAHDLYLRGRYLWNTRQMPDVQESARLFERALNDDPNYALAYAGLADAYTVMAVNQQMSPAEAIPPAKAALQRALDLDPNLAQAHATLGLLRSQCEWDWRGAEQEFRRAIELQPNYAVAHHWAGLNYMMMGEFPAAESEFREAQLLDPLSLMITEGLAENFLYSRRYDQAIAVARTIPDPRLSWVSITRAYIFKGMSDEAMKTMPEFIDARDPNRMILTAEVLGISGHRDAAFEALRELENRQGRGGNYGFVSPADLAMAYAIMNDKDRAFQWLEKAYQQHDPPLAQLKVDPAFDPLRSDPRYLALVKAMQLSN